MRRLYVQIWLSFLAIGLGSLAVSTILALLLFGLPEPNPADAALAGVTALIRVHHPGEAEFVEAFAALADHTGHELSLWDPDGELVAATGQELPFGAPGVFHAKKAVGVRLALPDGRILAAAHGPNVGRRLRFLWWSTSFAAVVALGCLPLARRITRRLEEVQLALVRWGEGDLDARVPVRGRDEVAAVARAFNEAADQVRAQFEAQRRMLASASHELRSPLARLRMALELLEDGGRPELRAAAIRDVEELDETVGDLLQVGRLQAGAAAGPREPVSLASVLGEEAARVGAVVVGADRVVSGDRRLLRRLVRNLLENAARHGAPPIEVVLGPDGFTVSDGGAGVPEELRERIFEPFFRPAGHAEGRDGGVGLGLYLAREIALHHGGTLTCEPRDEGGTRFRVRFHPDG